MNNIMKFAGAWEDVSDEEAEEMKRNIANFRKGLNRRIKEIIMAKKRIDKGEFYTEKEAKEILFE